MYYIHALGWKYNTDLNLNGYCIVVFLQSQNYEFINVPPSHFICPISKHIMLDPQKTRCCNKHIAKETIQNRQRHGEPCPICFSTNFEFRPDPSLQEKTRTAKIHCPYSCEGCHWEGDVGRLSTHLRGADNYCPHSLIKCPHSCGDSAQRHSLAKHLDACTVFNAPLKCKHCGMEYPRTASHEDTCKKALVCCPYKCGEELERGKVQTHLKVCSKLQPTPRKHESKPEEYVDCAIDILDSGRRHIAKFPVHPDHEGDQLLSIAKEMLTLRSKLPDVRIQLLEATMHLQQVALHKHIDRSEYGIECGVQEEQQLEQEEVALGVTEEELQREEEQIERELTSLRIELHKAHREITNKRRQ